MELTARCLSHSLSRHFSIGLIMQISVAALLSVFTHWAPIAASVSCVCLCQHCAAWSHFIHIWFHFMLQTLTPPAETWEPVMFERETVTASCVCVCVQLISLTVISVTLFTLCSGRATWRLLAAEFTACWLDTVVRGGVWRETVRWCSLKHQLTFS